MNKHIKLCKNITILSLFLFVFGLVCITSCIIFLGVSHSNIAYAVNYNDNLFEIGRDLTRFGDTSFSGTRTGGITGNTEYANLDFDNISYGKFALWGFNSTKNLATFTDVGADLNFSMGLGTCSCAIGFYTTETLYSTTTYTFSFNVVSSDYYNNFAIGVANWVSPGMVAFGSNSRQITLGLNSFVFSPSVNDGIDILYFYCTNSCSSIVIDKIKLEVGTTFTGWLSPYEQGYVDGYNDGYDDGINDMPLNNLPGGVYWDSFRLSELPMGADSLFTYNDLNYRFSCVPIASDTSYVETTVHLSWSFGSNGDTNHRYLGFQCPDNFILPTNAYINLRTSKRDRGYFICFNGERYLGLVDISQLTPYGSYQLEVNSDNTQVIYSLYVPLLDGTTSFYYVSSLDDRYSNAGDIYVFDLIDVYFVGDVITTGDYNSIFQKGYNKGYDDAVDLNEMNFYSLFGAIYDVPIKAFNGLFDITILGVNLKGFILGLISLCIVLFILKIVFK